MANFFISDLHFGHKNILSYDNRRFRTIEEHDQALIENWNNAVGMGDNVYILGDLSWHTPKKTIEIFKELSGIKHLIVGNHDHEIARKREFKALLAEIVDYKELTFSDGSGIVLCHYPIPCFNKQFYGWIHLYGHVHNSFEWNMMKRVQYETEELYGKQCRMYNVGAMIDYMGYTPRTLDEILNFNEG